MQKEVLSVKQKQSAPPSVTVAAELWTQTLPYQEEPVLSLSIRRPKLPEETAALRRMERYYQNLAKAVRTRWETKLFPRACQALDAAREQSRPFRRWSASFDFSVTLQEAGLLSLVVDIQEDSGLAHGTVTRLGDVWDLSSGTPRPISSFFPPHSRPKQILLHAAAQQLRQRVASGEYLYYSDWEQRLRADFSPARFYLSAPGELSFFYPLYTLAPYAEGIPTFTVPLPDSSPSRPENAE